MCVCVCVCVCVRSGAITSTISAKSTFEWFYKLPVAEEDICRGSTGRQRENSAHYLSGPLSGMEVVLAAQKGMMAGWTWMLAETVFCFSFSPPGILSLSNMHMHHVRTCIIPVHTSWYIDYILFICKCLMFMADGDGINIIIFKELFLQFIFNK